MGRFVRYLLAGYFFTLCILTLPRVVLGQHVPRHAEEAGAPFFFDHFGHQEYRYYPQNWSITQDRRGLIYVGNKNGVLEYDGTSWRIIETETVVRSLALGPDGRVYVGLSGDFGYLTPDDSISTMQYHSLVGEMRSEDREFADVWGTHATSEGIFFQTRERLYRWDGEEIAIWKSEEGFHTSFSVGDRFYVRDRGKGLMQMGRDGLHLVLGMESIADQSIYALMHYDGDGLLIGTRKAGFFVYRDGNLTPFPTEIDALLKEYPLYHGCVLPGGFYALATLGKGILIIDEQGRLVRTLHKDSGFPDDWVNYVYTDAQGGLWAALDAEGIARVDIPSRLTAYDDMYGMNGTVESITHYQGTVYVGTTTSLLKLQQPVPEDRSMIPSLITVLEGKPTPAVLSADNVLFAATHDGLFAIRSGAGKKAEYLSDGVFYSLAASRRLPGQIWVGKKDGLSRLTYTSRGWKLQDVYRGKAHPEDEVRAIAEDEDGSLWLSAADGTLMWFRFMERSDAPIVERFTRTDGLPGDRLGFLHIGDEVAFVSEGGIYRFDRDKGVGSRFYYHPVQLSTERSSSAKLLDAAQDKHGNVWMVYEDRVDIASLQADGTYRRETPAVLRFPKSTAVGIYIEESGTVWLGNGSKLIRYDPSIEKAYDTPFDALLRRMVLTRTEEVVYDGAPSALDAEGPVLDYDDRDIRFEVSAPSYNDVTGHYYQYYLEGHDKTWTDWTPSASATYHDLTEGVYKLRVRARNGQGVVSTEAIYLFRVLPPWFRTWWAYLIYVIFFLSAVGLTWRYRLVVEENKRAQEQARELERERELNKRLQEANESLMQVNKLKDEFLANTSHELRTPLTAILGFSTLLRDELPEPLIELLDPIEENGQRLLSTLNSLLDLAQLRAGMMEVNLRPMDIAEETYETMRLLTPLAHQKKLQYHYDGPDEPVYASLDRQYYERILTNLIGNAVKFTEEGEVRVEVKQHDDRVYVSVRDTGIGIEKDFVPYLFDEFKQESSGMARLHEGNGLGLAITAQLVQLMKGEIGVRSEKGKGSVFTVSFPVDRSEQAPTALAQEEMSPSFRTHRSKAGSQGASEAL